MGIYVIPKDELRGYFERWLNDMSGEGEIHAETLAEVWNELAVENGWIDKLYAKIY